MKKEITAEQYERNYYAFKYGYLAQEDWKEFCFEVLLQIMEQNSEILKRLKERD